MSISSAKAIDERVDVNFESALDPCLSLLCQPNWYQRPQSSNVYGPKSTKARLNASHQTLGSALTKAGSSRRNVMSGKPPSKKPGNGNHDLWDKTASIRSSHDPHMMTTLMSNSRPNLVSPRVALTSLRNS